MFAFIKFQTASISWPTNMFKTTEDSDNDDDLDLFSSQPMEEVD